MLLITTTVNK